ncbi:deoxynucleoside kinase [Patescibacteria group bacterium]|nr:deoxynucleoside kinase [Patescibacteria group bacterium]
MSHFITIAGPQASGKTTALNHLKKHHQDWFFLEDINPFTVIGKNHPGAAYTDTELEGKILEIVSAKLHKIENHYDQIIVAEMGIFHLVYGQFIGSKKLSNQFLPKFLKIYNEFNSSIVFINITPNVSFARKRKSYRQRILAKGTTDDKEISDSLTVYKHAINNIYPYWLDLYQRLDFPKITIENSDLTEKEFLAKLDSVIKKIINR